MKLVPPIALFSGGCLMASAAIVAIALWISASTSGTGLLLPQPPSPTFASTLEQSTSLEGIRKACAFVAEGHDTQMRIIRAQTARIVQLINIMAWGIVGVGFVVGPIFLYIYFATRRHVAPGSIAP